MIFTDAIFFIFFPIVFAGYWLLKSNELRKVWLLAASAIFYAAWDIRFLGLVALVIANAYTTPLLMMSRSSPRWRQSVLAIGILLSLSLLCYFKYEGIA